MHSRKSPDRSALRQKLIGLGENSLRKSYYSQLVATSEELKHRELYLKALFENTSDCIFSLDTNRILKDCNPAFLRTFGYSEEQVINRSAESFHPSVEAYREFGEIVYQDIHRFGSWRGEWHFRKGDGSLAPFEVVLAEQKDSAGQVVGYVGILRDITERKRSEEALRQREEEYRTLVDNIPDYIVRYDEKLRCTFFNRAWKTGGGLGTEQVVDATVRLVPGIPPEVCQRYFSLLEQTLESGEARGVDISWVTGQGNELYYECTMVPEPDQQGRVGGVLVVGRDLSARKRAEGEKRRLEAQLRQAQKMEAVGTLAGGIAHDFNNILGAVMGFSELARLESQQGQDIDGHLSRIVAATERARLLVRQLLTFSRRSEVELKPLDLNERLAESAQLLKHTIPKMIAIEMKLAGNLEAVKADATQLEQVILNLANNACDAMPDGGRLVFETGNETVEDSPPQGHPEILPGKYVVLKVSDTGRGMAPEVMEKVFDPFFTTKGTGKGTGLGLSTVYGIAREHGGYVTCQSRPGLGATFKVYFPACHGGMASRDDAEAIRGDLKGGTETILLVDDEEQLRFLGSAILEKVGYQVFTAATGEDALNSYREKRHKVDLVILDLGMPGMGGQKCFKQLRELDPDLKILIASGYAAEESIKGMIEQGAAGYIAKPFKLENLLSTVRESLDA